MPPRSTSSTGAGSRSAPSPRRSTPAPTPFAPSIPEILYTSLLLFAPHPISFLPPLSLTLMCTQNPRVSLPSIVALSLSSSLDSHQSFTQAVAEVSLPVHPLLEPPQASFFGVSSFSVPAASDICVGYSLSLLPSCPHLLRFTVRSPLLSLPSLLLLPRLQTSSACSCTTLTPSLSTASPLTSAPRRVSSRPASRYCLLPCLLSLVSSLWWPRLQRGGERQRERERERERKERREKRRERERPEAKEKKEGGAGTF